MTLKLRAAEWHTLRAEIDSHVPHALLTNNLGCSATRPPSHLGPERKQKEENRFKSVIGKALYCIINEQHVSSCSDQKHDIAFYISVPLHDTDIKN